MESPGEYLKREREIRGVSLEDISDETKIRVGILTAIEKNDFCSLPPIPFVKGFIQSYCKYIGIDQQDALLRYEAYLRDIEESRVAAEEEIKRGDKKSALKQKTSKKSLPAFSPTMKYSALVSAVIILVIGGALYVLSLKHIPSGSDSSITQVGHEDSNSQHRGEISFQPTKPEDQLTMPGDANLSSPATGTEQSAPWQKADAGAITKNLTLVIEAVRPTWIRAEVDDQNPFEVSLKEGEKVTWRAKEKFSILVGNAGGVNVTFNGNPLGRLGDNGKVVKLILPSIGDIKLLNLDEQGESTHP